MKKIFIIAIIFYQKFISPYKGFRCAHAALYNGTSCSEAIKIIIQENEVLKSWPLIKNRFHECSVAYEKLEQDEEKKKKKKRKCFNYIEAPCDILECIPIKRCGGKPQPKPGADCDLPCDLPCGRGF